MSGRNLTEEDLQRVESELFKLKSHVDDLKNTFILVVFFYVASYGIQSYLEFRSTSMKNLAEKERSVLNSTFQQEIDDARNATWKAIDDARNANQKEIENARNANQKKIDDSRQLAELKRSVGHCIVSGKNADFCRNAYGIEKSKEERNIGE